MSEFEMRRRSIARKVFLQAWAYYRKSIEGVSFSEALALAWRTVRGMQRLVYSKVRGVSMNNTGGSSRQRILARLSTYPESKVTLYFTRDYFNDYDENAIKIVATVHEKGSACVGYLSSELAKEVAPLIDEGNIAIVFFLGVTGGDKVNYGMNFCFSILPIPICHTNKKPCQIAL